MELFNFEAKTLAGKIIKGKVKADSEAEARLKIRAEKLIPLKVGRAQKRFQAFTKKKTEGGTSLFRRRVKPKELQIFTRQFSVLVSAGVPIVQGLEAMAGQGRGTVLNEAISDILDRVNSGGRLADAMSYHPKIFDRMYVNLVRAGEEGGVLDVILARLAEYIEKSVKIKSRIRGALMYPAIVLVVAFVIIALILTFVIPSFVNMFEQNNLDLPALTQAVIDLSENFKANWYYYLLGFIMSIFGIKTYYQTPGGKRAIDKLLIRSPIFGVLVQKGSLARFSRTLATMLQAGVRIVEALDIAASTAGNFVIESSILRSKEFVSKGRSLVDPLKTNKYIPQMVTQMIFIGEQTGNLDVMLQKIADFYEDEVEVTADTLTSLIEPLMMIFLGGIIAVLVLSMYLPIFQMASAFG
ncbi:MAG: type II secretion system F family protein [Bdellovibrio sp.]|nr:MAG: type II secretion system F family protein [Bdellovibrio sp.]